MFHQTLYPDNGEGMLGKVIVAVVVIVVLYFLYKSYKSENVVTNPYAGTFYGMVPFTIFKGAVPVPAANY
jgi:hypothetical protein